MNQIPLPIGTKLNNGRYVVLKILGRGGFGVVYGCEGDDGRKWALKEAYGRDVVYRSENGFDLKICSDTAKDKIKNTSIHTHQCKRAKEEAELFENKKLKHSNLIEVLGTFEQFGTVYLIMPWIQGESLDMVLQMQAARTSAWKKNILNQLASALTVLHENNLIHRDLKPDNILLTNVAGAPVPIIIDMGTTRNYVGTNKYTGIATDFGAPEIMSPHEETVYGKPCSATDCFSLAGIAFWMISGYKPASYPARSAALHAGKGIDPLGQPPEMNHAVWKVLQKGLQLNVAARYFSAQQLANELFAAWDVKDVLQKNVNTNTNTNANSKLNQQQQPEKKISKVANTEQFDAAGLLVSLLSIAAVCVFLVAVFDEEIGILFALMFILINFIIAALCTKKYLPVTLALMPGVNLFKLLSKNRL